MCTGHRNASALESLGFLSEILNGIMRESPTAGEPRVLEVRVVFC